MHNGIHECSQQVGVQQLLDTLQLMKSVVAARADTDVVIQTQIGADERGCRQRQCRHQAEVPDTCHSAWRSCDLSWQTAVPSYWREFQPVVRHPVADVQDALLKLVNG